MNIVGETWVCVHRTEEINLSWELETEAGQKELESKLNEFGKENWALVQLIGLGLMKFVAVLSRYEVASGER